jgi:hypothetical protein
MRKSELFTELTKRNALRREAQLPLLDLRRELQKQEIIEAWKEYYTIQEAYEEKRKSILDRISREYAVKYGVAPDSAGGHWIVLAKAEREFEAYLETIGYKKPPPIPGQAIFYGGDTE